MSSPRLTRGRHSQIGGFYSVTTVALGRRPWFQAAEHAGFVIEQFRASDAAGLTQSHAWVVMPDHVHWMFKLREGSLSTCMQRFKSLSARAIRIAGRSGGPIWQAGYYDHRLLDEDDWATQARYIVENPVRKHLVSRWQDYPYAWCRWDMP